MAVRLQGERCHRGSEKHVHRVPPRDMMKCLHGEVQTLKFDSWALTWTSSRTPNAFKLTDKFIHIRISIEQKLRVPIVKSRK